MRRYVETIIRYRFVVIGLTVLLTVFMIHKSKQLKVVINPDTILPQNHPFIVTTNKVEKVFGSRWVVMVGVTPKTGDVFQPAVLAKVQRITQGFYNAPFVVKSTVVSVAARRAKNIAGSAEGMQALPLMEKVPETPQALEELRRAIHSNPVYTNAIISPDDRTLSIIAEFKPKKGFRGIMATVNPIVDHERDDSVEINISGFPAFLAQLEHFSQRMEFFFPLALLLIGLIHYEAFRTVQGLILPLVTAFVAVLWGKGIMGIAGVPMDIFNATTPILILAIAAGHAVQILKRYYEEYHRLRADGMEPHAANRAAVVESVSRIAPVMLTAGLVAALGFFSLIVFEITTIRTFGVFTALGILSALVLEMTFIPALRSLLPAPKEREARRERERRLWDRITERMADVVTGPSRTPIFVTLAVVLVASGFGLTRIVNAHSVKSFFFQSLPLVQQDRVLNGRLGGTNTVYVLVEGAGPDAIKNPEVLRGIEATQRFLEQQPNVGKTLSIVDFLKRMNKAMHADDPAEDKLPTSQDLVAQYLLLYSSSGEPGDFDTYVDYNYQAANIWVFVKTDSTAYFQDLIGKLAAFTSGGRFPPGIKVSVGGGITNSAAIAQVMVHTKILNILQIGGVILLITALVFRSLAAGIFVLVPLVITVLVNFGLMGLTGIRLNVMTSIISPMAVGIGADYAIYFIFRLREELARGADEITAFRTTFTTAGKAILFVASAIAGGYGVLLFSWGFNVHIWMAILIATAMLTSSISTLLVMTSLIFLIKPRVVYGKRPTAATGTKSATAAVVLLLLAFPSHARAAEPSAHDIMARNFMSTKVLDSIYDGTMRLIHKNGQERIRKTTSTTKLQSNGVDNMRLVQFLAPPDVKGTSTLLIEHSEKDDDIWIYLPALKKVRRLVASNKKDSFVGSDLSYGDVIGHKVEEWEHKLLREDTFEGHPCYVIESVPKSEAVRSSTGYSRRLSWIQKDNAVALKVEYWDQAGQPLKTSTWQDVRLVDSAHKRWWPMHIEVVNAQTGHRTLIQFENFRSNQHVKDEVFTPRYIERE